ncbi:hypothetical protein M5K25_017625 [Dendrobium thyrsiflorum]|uniref:60S ribosomal protein L29 n=1 Tax=Dendrobium thyrsiflorum TaxID=117978 RepID=A0ABD0UMS5_DENTH
MGNGGRKDCSGAMVVGGTIVSKRQSYFSGSHGNSSLVWRRMAKSKNHTAHNQSHKAHKNGIKKPKRHRHTSTRGVWRNYLFSSFFIHLSVVTVHDFVEMVCLSQL